MTVKQCLKEKGLQSEVVDFKRYQIVAIAFYNMADDREDEVTFDIQHAGTKAGEEELEELFSNFCKEEKCSPDSVLSVTVVASAQTKKELEKINM